MTSITRISLRSHCNDLGGKIWNPAIRWTEKHAILVEIEDSDGRIGIGECWCFEASPLPLSAFIRFEVAPHFIGADLSALEEISDRLVSKATLTARHGILRSALSGIDIAVWDLRAKAAEIPLYGLLDPASDGTIQLYGSGGLYGSGKNADMLAREMVDIADLGFDLVKMKVGALALEDDAARINAVLRALPAHTRLIIDGVYSFDADDAQRLYGQLPADRIEAFQSPVPASDLRGMKALSEAGVPVMATEAEYREEMHRALVEEVGVAFLQVAPVACGGITRLSELRRLTAPTPTLLSLEISSTAIALMAASHFAGAVSEVAHVEYHFVHQVFFDSLTFKPSPVPGGRHQLPHAAGLGIGLPHGNTQLQFELTDTPSIQ